MLEVKNIDKHKGEEKVLDNLSLELRENEINVILGPSGCGKTTLTRIILGLEEQDSGNISIEGNVSPVFQEPRLLEWKSVEENLEIVERLSSEESAERSDVLKNIGMYDERRKMPSEISGGMKQRVAFGRALMKKPDILILDEPFNSLDFKSKIKLQEIIAKTVENKGMNVLYVTHDLESAVRLGDKIIILSEKPSDVRKILHASDYEKEEKLRAAISETYLKGSF